MSFYPEEVLFCPTTSCNLRCHHCTSVQEKRILSAEIACRFLRDCKKRGILKVGFTGGEPFLALSFLCRVIRESVREEMFFGRIMTNAVWFQHPQQLRSALAKIHQAGFDGQFSISVDALHKQSLVKVALFINQVQKIWQNQVPISLVSVWDVQTERTRIKLKKLAHLLRARLEFKNNKPDVCRSKTLVLPIFTLGLEPVGKASYLKSAWSRKWFSDSLRCGPGNIFFVIPDGVVKPCCGYASDEEQLTLGNIKTDSVKKILHNAENNRLIQAIYGEGLASLRKCLARSGVRFPGKTDLMCYFCWYLLTQVSEPIVASVLDKRRCGR